MKLTGVANTVPLHMAEYREKSQKPFWIRYVLVPGWNDQEKIVTQFAKTFQNYKYIERVDILPYHTLGAYKYKEMNQSYLLEGVSLLKWNMRKNSWKNIFRMFLFCKKRTPSKT